MMLEYTDNFDKFDIGDKQLRYNMQLNEADSEESYLGLGLMKNNQRTWFDYKSKEPEIESGYDPDNILFSVEYLLERDVLIHNRSIYTALDLLGDVGGLFDALKGISTLVVAFYFQIFGSPIDEYLLKSMFLRNTKQSKSR